MIIARIPRLPLLSLPVLVTALLPSVAQTHPGRELAVHPLLSGELHPLTGVDHLAAMVVVGLWGGALAGRTRWAVPLAFVSAMIVGYGYGFGA